MTDAEQDDVLKTAIRQREAGRSTIPIEAGGKKPAVGSWREYQETLPSREMWETWRETNPDCGIALITGKVSDTVMIDIDTGDGLPPVRERRETILQRYATDWIVQTPSGGEHLAYQHPGDGKVPNRTDIDAIPGVDIRGDGGYVLIPPTPGYEWIRRGEPGDTPPSFVLEPSSNGASPPAQRESGWAAEAMRGVEEGARDDTATRLAGKLLGRGLEPAVVEEMLLLWNLRNDPPLPGEQVRKCVRSIAKKEREKLEEEQSGGRLQIAGGWRDFTSRVGPSKGMLVDDWMTAASLLFVIGPPGTYKTWLLLSLAYSVATGEPFLGRWPVRRTGPVLVLQQEDAGDKVAGRLSHIHYSNRIGLWRCVDEEDRFRALIDEAELEDIRPATPDSARLRLDEPDLMRQLAEIVEEVRPELVVVDPLYSAGNLEDYLAQAAQDTLGFKDLRDQFGTSFAIGHHVTNEKIHSTERSRGWGSQFLKALVEVSWQIRPGEGDQIYLRRFFKERQGDSAEKALKFDINYDFGGEPPDWAGPPPRYDVKLVDPDEEDGEVADPMDEDELKRRIYHYIEREGQCSAGDIYDHFGVRRDSVREARDELEEGGYIRNETPDKPGDKWVISTPLLSLEEDQSAS